MPASSHIMQRSLDTFSAACTNFGLTIDTNKTKVMHQPAPADSYMEPNFTVDGKRLAATNKFIYLGSTLSRTVNIDEEVTYRIARASSAFGRLRTKVWERRGITLQTKLKVYRAVVLPSLLYACESWTVYSRHAKQLNGFHLRCLRKLLRIKWQDRVPDTEVLRMAKSESIHATLKRSQLRWAGHVCRMPDERLPKKLFFGELCQGKRSRGGQRKRYKDMLKATLKGCRLNPNTWESDCQDRPSWRTMVSCGVTKFEDLRMSDAEQKRQIRKSKSTSSSQPSTSTLACPHCQRLFKARIGLVSHLRIHNTSRT